MVRVRPGAPIRFFVSLLQQLSTAWHQVFSGLPLCHLSNGMVAFLPRLSILHFPWGPSLYGRPQWRSQYQPLCILWLMWLVRLNPSYIWFSILYSHIMVPISFAESSSSRFLAFFHVLLFCFVFWNNRLLQAVSWSCIQPTKYPLKVKVSSVSCSYSGANLSLNFVTVLH